MKQMRMAALVGVSVLGLSTPALAQANAPEQVGSDVQASGQASTPGDLPSDQVTESDEPVPSDNMIIVQARRRDESLQDVPLSVQAVTGNELAKLELRNFSDVAAVVPGLQLTRAPGGVQNTVTMRGVSFNSTATGPQTAVELYRNDVVTTSSAIFQALYDVGQIEVLRGPQGTLRGRASPSGSITITTRRPDVGEAGGFMEGSAAENGQFSATGAINVPIVGNVLAVRVAGYASGGPGNEVERVNLITGAVDDDVFDRVQSIRASVRADPFDGVLLLDANYEAISRESRSFLQVESRRFSDASGLSGPVAISAEDRRGIQVEPFRVDSDFKFYNWQAQLRQFGQLLTYVGGRNVTDNNSISPEDPAGILRSGFALARTPNAQGGFNINPFAQITNSVQEQNVHEIRLQNEDRIAGLFDYVVGYLSIKQNTPTFLYTPTTTCVGGSANCAVGGLETVTLGGTYRIRSDKENSFFGNLTAHLGDRTEISGGIRRIKFERISGLQSGSRGTGALAGTPSPDRPSVDLVRAQPEVASFAVNDSVSATIYTLSAKHEVTDDLMVYATYGTSFRPGNIVVCARCTSAEGAILNAGGFLTPEDETSKSIEAGFKASLFDRRLTANLSVYRQTFDNFTIGSPEPVQFLSSLTPATLAISGTTNTLVTAVPVQITGFEAQLVFQPSDRFNIGANIAFADGKVKGNGRIPCLDLDNNGFQDTSLVPNTPEGRAAFAAGISPAGGFVDTCPISRASPAPRWSASAQGEYNHPVSDAMEGFVRGLLTYNGSTPGDDTNPVDAVSAYGLLNLYLGLRDPDGAWDISLFGKNLTGTERVLTRTGSLVTSTIANASFPSAYRQITTTAPRQFGVSARIAFGSR
jgi:iron complex outermembrane recepter protein